jgi:heme-degrading monooxygenase HmoA
MWALPRYLATPGNRRLLALRRVAGDRAELLLVTLWESEEAIRRCAGNDVGSAVYHPEDERFLVDRGERVTHFEVVYRGGEAPAAGAPEGPAGDAGGRR